LSRRVARADTSAVPPRLRLPRPRLPRVRFPAPLPKRLGIALRRNLTLSNLTERLAEVHKDRVAFVLPSRSVAAGRATITFRQADRAVARLAASMRAAGVGLGDMVAVLPSNGCDYLFAFLAVVRIGAVAVPINPILKPKEVRTLVDLSKARAVVTDPTTMRSSVGGKRALPGIKIWMSLPQLGRKRAPADAPVPVAPDTVVAVMYTSGTTGRPKGARLTNEGLLSLLSTAALNPTGLPGTVRSAVTALPIAHIMGLATALGLMLAGITNRMFPRFDPKRVLGAIERHGPELFIGVPAMYRSMLEAGAAERDLTSVKAWASAADVMPRDLARKFQSFGRLIGPIPAAFLEAYGMVELGGAAMARVSPPGLDVLGRSAGVPLPPYHVKVVDEQGRKVAAGKVGELVVKGPGVLESYQGDPEATRKVLRGGWLRTGDLARMGPLGTVVLEGRKKEVIKVGGYSVFPVEVETELRRHPKVADAAVVGVRDSGKGTVPAAAVVPAKGKKLTPAELERWAHNEIASYRRPRRWLVLDELPRGSTRKADKRKIAGMFR
jgi:acyl-coenzyme A synthetase/AMP-(fatty) acid ligase